MSLGEELSYFRDHQEEFAKEHTGQFVLIYSQNVEGFYDDEIEAYVAAKRKFPEGTFLLRQCIRKEEEKAAIFRSRIA